MKKVSKGIVVNIVGSGTDEQRFCRRLSADVNQGQLHLAQVFVTGRQVYPSHIAVLGEPDMLFRCEFRLRNGVSTVTCEHISDLLSRLRSYHIVEAHLVDENGLLTDHVEYLPDLSA